MTTPSTSFVTTNLGRLHVRRVHRAGIDDLLAEIRVPTLVMSVRDDLMGWRPDEARATCAIIPDCRVEEVAGTGHISPLLLDAEVVQKHLLEFWNTST